MSDLSRVTVVFPIHIIELVFKLGVAMTKLLLVQPQLLVVGAWELWLTAGSTDNWISGYRISAYWISRYKSAHLYWNHLDPYAGMPSHCFVMHREIFVCIEACFINALHAPFGCFNAMWLFNVLICVCVWEGGRSLALGASNVLILSWVVICCRVWLWELPYLIFRQPYSSRF